VVRGLDVFKKHFESFGGMFVIIGGTASTLVLEEVGLDFRATKDIDIVLYVEALTREFAEAFWEFVEAGGYQNAQQSTGKPLFYRFYKPENDAYPWMLELFARKPAVIKLREGSHLTPIPMDEDVAGLSAILMDDAYYALAQNGGKMIDGIPVLSAEYLIPFKAKAWLDLSERRGGGGQVDDRDVRKHKNDVFRLYQIISPETRVVLPTNVARDMAAFLDAMVDDGPDLAQIGLRGIKLADAVRGLKEAYGVGTG
jgi:hypothetical protein